LRVFERHPWSRCLSIRSPELMSGSDSNQSDREHPRRALRSGNPEVLEGAALGEVLERNRNLKLLTTKLHRTLPANPDPLHYTPAATSSNFKYIEPPSVYTPTPSVLQPLKFKGGIFESPTPTTNPISVTTPTNTSDPFSRSVRTPRSPLKSTFTFEPPLSLDLSELPSAHASFCSASGDVPPTKQPTVDASTSTIVTFPAINYNWDFADFTNTHTTPDLHFANPPTSTVPTTAFPVSFPALTYTTPSTRPTPLNAEPNPFSTDPTCYDLPHLFG